MNPLDPQELKPFLRNLKEEMPIHTETTAKIKRSYSQGMPKNLMDYSAFVNNHFLNDNLAIIEEMQHRNKQHPIPKWFRDYQIRHYAKYGILKGDHFFGPFAKIFPDLGEHRGIGFLPYAGMTLGFGTIGDTKVFGSDIVVGSNTSSSGTGSNNNLELTKATAVVGEYYDRIAGGIVTQAGNIRMGVYDDNGNPNNVLSEIPSTTMPTAGALTWITMPEFAITTVTIWLAMVYDSASAASYFAPVGGVGSYKNKAFTYGALPTAPSGLSTSNDLQKSMKIGHS